MRFCIRASVLSCSADARILTSTHLFRWWLHVLATVEYDFKIHIRSFSVLMIVYLDMLVNTSEFIFSRGLSLWQFLRKNQSVP